MSIKFQKSCWDYEKFYKQSQPTAIHSCLESEAVCVFVILIIPAFVNYLLYWSNLKIICGPMNIFVVSTQYCIIYNISSYEKLFLLLL